KLTDEELRFVLLHETLHCAHQHLWRLPPDENGNIAGDYCINRTLAGVPGISMPEGGLVCPPEFDLLAEEEIYAACRPNNQVGETAMAGTRVASSPLRRMMPPDLSASWATRATRRAPAM